MLDVHVLESVSILLSQELVEQGLLQVYPFDVEQRRHAVHMSSIANHMVHIPALVVEVDLLMDNILRCAQFRNQIKSYILEAKVPNELKRLEQ